MEYERLEAFKEKLKKELTEKRYAHTMRTLLMAAELCVGTEADRDVVFTAALLHDCAKYREADGEQKATLKDYLGYGKVIHAPLGAILAKEEYGVTDERVLDCIRYHATGHAGMNLEEMIVFLADAIEDGRDYPGVEKIREKTKVSLEAGVLASLEGVLEHEKGHPIHPDTENTIRYLREKGAKE